MKTRTKRACEYLIESLGGEGNERYQILIAAALLSSPVREAVQEVIAHYDSSVASWADAKALVGLLE